MTNVLLVLALIATACGSPAAPRPPIPAADLAFLDTLQSRTFDFFWQTTNPRNGLAPDRYPTPSFSSVAAIGFALTAYPVGVERGYITRAQAAERTLTTLRFLWRAPQGGAVTNVAGHKGFFYHFLDMETGHRFKTVELSTIDTALLIAGVLFAQTWFAGPNAVESEIRALADSLYRRVDWPWAQARPPAVSMGWHPERGFIAHDWRGYNEAMILLLLALGSPTHPIAPDAWTAWTSTYQWGTFYGYEHVGFAPLFGHQYSHAWIDFRGIKDSYMRARGIDYFENSRRATLSQRAYAVANPMGWRGYGAELWGLTASDGPKGMTRIVDGVERKFFTYAARGASFTEVRDDGTIAPTAAGGSIPFAPEVTIAALQAMRARYGERLFREYGFLDAFNPTFTFTDVAPQHGSVSGDVWIDGDYLGIDQGPILLMAENHRSALVWETMKRNPYIVRGLCRAGFTGGWLEGRCE
ncbi:MAG: glucoamylase family protein [Gemmatimonadota bacterium]